MAICSNCEHPTASHIGSKGCRLMVRNIGVCDCPMEFDRTTGVQKPLANGGRVTSDALKDIGEVSVEAWALPLTATQSFARDRGESISQPPQPSARSHQVGGNHYRGRRIQPWDIWEAYNLSAFEGAIIKYLLRDKGNRLEDLKKARHTLDKLIEIEEGERDS